MNESSDNNNGDDKLIYELKLENSDMSKENIKDMIKILDIQDNSTRRNEEKDSLDLKFDQSLGLS